MCNHNKGQALPALISSIIVGAVLIFAGLWIVSEFSDVSSDTLADTGTSTTTTSENSTFSTDPDASWDNQTTDNSTAAWSDNGVTTADNYVGDNCGGGTSICFFYQSITVPTYDSVTSATISADWSIDENENLEDIHIRVRLGRPGGDNVEVYYADNTTHTENSWQSVDNTITSSINAAGAYTLYLYDNTTRASDSADNSVSARWDNASLSVTTYLQSAGENAQEDTEETIWDVFGMLPMILLIMVIVAVVGIIVTRLT